MHDSTVELLSPAGLFSDNIGNVVTSAPLFRTNSITVRTNQSSSSVTEELAQYFLSERLSWSRKVGTFLVDLYCWLVFF